jgi:DNA-binding response OmpR family regulator
VEPHATDSKPFGMEKLLARLRAALRRRGGGDEPPPTPVFCDLTVDLARRLVTLRGESASDADRARPRVYVRALRRKLGDDAAAPRLT